MKVKGPAWSELWLDALAHAGWGARIKRGAAYVREGLVDDLQVRPGAVAADMLDPSAALRHPRLAVRPLSGPEWADVAIALLQEPALAAALEAGTWPPAIAPALAAAGIGLLPGAADLVADCGCGERPPCRHVAALCYALAAALDADPWLVPLLRGRTRPALARLLAEARAVAVPEAVPPATDVAPGAPLAKDAPPAAPPVEIAAADATSAESEAALTSTAFWELGADLSDFHPEIAAPAQPAPLLRQLGPPPFWTPSAAFAAQLEPLYAAVSAAILRLAHGDDDI